MGTFTDLFDDGSLDTVNFGTSVNNNGTVTESLANSRLEVVAPSVVADAAITYFKKINPSRSNTWQTKNLTARPAFTGGGLYSLVVQSQAAAPFVDTITNQVPRFAVGMFSLNGGAVRFEYRSTGGTQNYWNGTIWTSTPSSVPGLVMTANVYYTLIIDCDGANFIYTVKDATETSTLLGPVSIATSSVNNSGGTDWILWGDLWTTNNIGTVYSTGFTYTGPEIVTTVLADTSSSWLQRLRLLGVR